MCSMCKGSEARENLAHSGACRGAGRVELTVEAEGGGEAGCGQVTKGLRSLAETEGSGSHEVYNQVITVF